MNLAQLLRSSNGIVHRAAARDAGIPDSDVRRAVAAGHVRVIRRTWICGSGADADLVAAAEAGGRLGCLSLARRRGWWVPEDADTRRHISMLPHARRGTFGESDVVHWSRPVVAPAAASLEESVEDALAHIVACVRSPESARVLWESAVRVERLSPDALRRVGWTTRAARDMAERLVGLSDSGLETIFVARIGHLGVSIRQQIHLAGQPVDVLIGDRLVVQIDGYGPHSSSAQRSRDIAHDAELRLRGYTVIRISYAQVLHQWPAVERRIARAVAAGLHRASAR